MNRLKYIDGTWYTQTTDHKPNQAAIQTLANLSGRVCDLLIRLGNNFHVDLVTKVLLKSVDQSLPKAITRARQILSEGTGPRPFAAELTYELVKQQNDQFVLFMQNFDLDLDSLIVRFAKNVGMEDGAGELLSDKICAEVAKIIDRTLDGKE